MSENIHRGDFQACRVCLATDIKLISLQHLELKRMYSEFSGVPIMATDGLPQHICVFCCAMLKKSAKFRKKCEATYYLLLEHVLEKQDLTTAYIDTIDRTNLQIPIKISKILNCYCIPDELSPIYKEENYVKESTVQYYTFKDELNETEAIVGKPCITFEVKLNPTEPTLHESCSRLKDEINETNQTVDEPCFTFKEELNETEAIVVEPCFSFEEELSETEPTIDKPCSMFNEEMNVPEQRSDGDPVNATCFRVKDSSELREKGIKLIRKSFEKYCKEYNFEAIMMSKNEKLNDVLERRYSEKYKRAEYKCELCYTGFSVENTFENHKALHDPRRPYECEYCHLRFMDASSRSKHLNVRHNRKLVCRQCGRVVRCTSAAREHFKSHSGSRYDCKHCGMKFEKNTTRINHIRKHHGNVSDDISHIKITEELFKCPSCLVQFENASDLRRHAERNADCGAHVRACTQCGDSFPDDLTLEEHMTNKHLTENPSATSLEEGSSSRRRRPGDQQNYICELCAREFKYKYALRDHHQMKHSDERPFVCDHCGKTFKSKTIVGIHILRVHSAPRYPCPKPQCSRAFRQIQHLASHMLAHSNEKTFCCDICQLRFKHSASLSVHKQTIHEGKPTRKRSRK